MNFHRKPARFEWAKLNADGLFVALLIIGAGLYDFFLWDQNPIVAHGNFQEGWLVQARAATYILAGIGLLWSLISAKIHQEVMARFVFLGAVAFQIWRRWLEFGSPMDPAVSSVIVLFVIYAVASWLRFKVLLAKDGLVFTIPPRKQE